MSRTDEKDYHHQAAGVLSVAALSMGALAACGGPGTVTVHGTVTPNSASAGVFGPGMTSTSYAGCATANPAPGTQVTVTDSSGKVLGVGTLGAWSAATRTVSGVTIYPCTMPFTITVVTAGEPRYGFAISGVPGTQWETGVNNVALQVTGGS
jgi:hypothetical protein